MFGGAMKKHLYKFETTMWLSIKFVFYILLMYAFLHIMGKDSIGLTRLSRMLGITVSTFVVVGLLFLSVYGRYDVGSGMYGYHHLYAGDDHED